ncbi:hypothetical protein DL764_009929 [Monosporascus ibericus]|uniref:FAD/NAD(P)-binding domain-containing protein n=1 Tax=Monosporascus ibericus TaxID=155417 RepID=A0A4Q4SWS0_9PEZI|nr:hypothetical protein DL764_009929 [Monosporascus ibericus]
MAAVDAVPSSERVVPGSVNIPIAEWPATMTSKSVDARAVASKVVSDFNQSLAQKDHKAIADLFVEHGYWRDHLGLTWDLRTAKGKGKIIAFLENGHHLLKVDLDESSPSYTPQVASLRRDGSVKGIEFFTIVTSQQGSGRGVVRLVEDAGQWKIWTFYTSMDELSGHEEPLGPNRESGVQHGALAGRKNWLNRRVEECNFEHGSGQAGLSIHARLKMLGVSALAIDVNDEIGDNWRNRYHQLVLHDPVWYDHMPYISFPKFWPVFTPKDKLAEFLKSYAQMLELNVWNNTTVQSSSWNDSKKEWTVVLKRRHKDGREETRTMHPKHIVQSTGHSGKKNYPQFKGMENFKGDVLCHSSDFNGAKKDAKGRKAVVIGSCNSALDISQDFYENGYDVTIIQRSTTAVMSSKTVLELLLGPRYSEDGPPTEDADLLGWSLPSEVTKANYADANELQEIHDREMLQGLNDAGFKTDRGPMKAGLWFKYLQRGGGYYIDVGTSQLIADGRIKVKQGVGVREILERAVRLEDGTELEADEIVCATGYQNMRTATEAIFGDEVAAKVQTVWGYDEEGETRTMWRRSGHPGLWLHGGNLAMCRYFSRIVALQIKAQLLGY